MQKKMQNLKIFIILTIILLTPFLENLKAQDNKFSDSLQKLLPKANDSFKAEIYLKLGNYYKSQAELDQSISAYEKALLLFDQENNSRKKAETFYKIGNIYKQQSKYLQSINSYQKSLKIYEELKDTANIVKACNRIGSGLNAKAYYDQAFAYYRRVINLLDKEKNYSEYSRALSNIGVLHRYNKEYDQALDYFNEALAINKKNNSEVGVIQAKFYISYIYIDTKKYKKALTYMKEVLEYAEKNKRPMSLALRYRAMGDIYLGLKNFKKSMDFYNLSLKYSLEMKNEQYIIFAYLKKAELLYYFKKFKKAEIQINKCLELAKKSKYKYLQKNGFHTSAMIKFALKKNKEAYQHMLKAFILQKELSLEAQKKGLTDAQAMFKTDLLQKKNKKQKLLIEEATERTNSLIIIMIIAIFIIGLFAILFISLVRKNNVIKKNNKKLEKQNNQISSQKKILEKTLTELKNTQAQLIESKKMASLGNLVAGVAHEMNTPIGISVQATSGIAERSKKIVEKIKLQKIKKEDIIDYIEYTYQSSKLAFNNLKRASKLVSSFKLVAVDQSTEKVRSFNAKKYFSDILLSLKQKLKEKNISIKIECDENLEINSYPGVFAQILTNFVINSIVHGFKNRKEGQILIKIQKDLKGYTLNYQDNGEGMNKEICKNIFEPFFTTNKQTGTGLGMHIVYNLITQKLKGKISCESSINKGVKFIIFFKEENNISTNLEN